MTEISLSQVWRQEVHDQGAGPFCSRREPSPGLQMATRRRAWRRGRGGSELSLSAREGTDLVTRAPPSCPRCLCNRCRHFGDSGFNISTGVGWGGGTQTSSRRQPPPTQLIAGSLGPALAPPPCSRLHAGPIFEPPATILLRVTGIGTPRPQLPATQRPGGLLKALSGQMSRPKTHWSPPSLGKAQTPQATVRDHGSAHWSWRLS